LVLLRYSFVNISYISVGINLLFITSVNLFSCMSLTVMLKIVSATHKAKAKAINVLTGGLHDCVYVCVGTACVNGGTESSSGG